jgi:hypothetical protein
MTLPLSSLLAASALLLSCSASHRSTDAQSLERPGDNAITTIVREHGLYSSQLETQLTTIVNTREELAALWAQVYADMSPSPALPEVDFTRESVILATTGTRSTGGYGVEIQALEEIPEGMRLVIVASSPGPTCGTTQALTTPLHIVRTRKLPAVVLFDWREKIVDCD